MTVKRLAVLAASVALALVLIEGVARLFRLGPTAMVQIAGREDFARIPGIYAPSRHWTNVGRASLRFDVTINSLGYRGPEPPAGGDALRVVFVGDSFTFGDFVNDDETWPAQVQARLACARPVVMYNAGVAGSTLTEAIEMASRARVLHPDAVIAEFTASNDLEDLSQTPLWARMDERRRMNPAGDFAVRFLARSALWNTVRQTLNASDARDRKLTLSEDAAQLEKAQRRYEQLMSQWAAELKRDGIPLLFAAYPGFAALSARDRSRQDWFIAAASRAGVRSVDLWPNLFRDGRDPAELYFVPRDAHPRANGYAIASEAVAKAMVSEIEAFKGCRVVTHQ